MSEVEMIEIVERGKLGHALHEWYRPQLYALISTLWDDPHWKEVIENRRFDSLPRLFFCKWPKTKVVSLFG